MLLAREPQGSPEPASDDRAPRNQGCFAGVWGGVTLAVGAGLAGADAITGTQLMLPMILAPYCTYPVAVGGECCAVNGNRDSRPR